MNPFVKRGNGNLPVIAEVADGAMTTEVCEQNDENKANGVRAVGNQIFGNQGVCVPTGGTPDTGDHDPCVGATTAGDSDHHALIAFEGCATTDGTAFRTAYLMKLDAGQCEVKESLVGRFPKIELDIRELNFYHST